MSSPPRMVRASPPSAEGHPPSTSLSSAQTRLSPLASTGFKLWTTGPGQVPFQTLCSTWRPLPGEGLYFPASVSLCWPASLGSREPRWAGSPPATHHLSALSISSRPLKSPDSSLKGPFCILVLGLAFVDRRWVDVGLAREGLPASLPIRTPPPTSGAGLGSWWADRRLRSCRDHGRPALGSAHLAVLQSWG